MDFLANLRLRRKLLIAMAPLAVMVVVAGLYSSIESKRIDIWYSNLIHNDIKTLRSVTAARELTTRAHMLLYQLIAEPYPDRQLLISGGLDKTQADYQAAIAEALRQGPKGATEIRAAGACERTPLWRAHDHLLCAYRSRDGGEVSTLWHNQQISEVQ